MVRFLLLAALAGTSSVVLSNVAVNAAPIREPLPITSGHPRLSITAPGAVQPVSTKAASSEMP